MTFKVATHTIVRNEDRFIWFAIKSVIDMVDQMIIYDTGSTDHTVKIINSFKSSKIIFKSTPTSTREGIVRLRNLQIKQTPTPWFMLLDGDEIWPQQNLLKLFKAAASASAETQALFNYTKNCINDIYHFLPQSKGKYQIKNQTGHLNIRLIKNTKGLKVKGKYPLEAYTLNNQPIQQLNNRLKFVNTWYLHATHLPRSTKPSQSVIDRKPKQKFRLGNKLSQSQLPQAFFISRPDFVPAPPTKPWHYFFPPK